MLKQVRFIVFLAFASAACMSAAPSRDGKHYAEQEGITTLSSLFSIDSNPSGRSDPYEQAHHVRVKAASIQNCDLLGIPFPSSIAFELPCFCPNSGYTYESYESPSPIGKCAVSLRALASPLLAYTGPLLGDYIFDPNFIFNFTKVTQVATVSVQCDWNWQVDECGLELGDDRVILEAQGPVYVVPNVAIPGAGPVTPLEGRTECIQRGADIFAQVIVRIQAVIARRLGITSLLNVFSTARQLLSKPVIQPRSTMPTNQPATGAKAQNYHEDTTNTYTKGAAFIAKCPVRLMGKHTNLKLDEGFMQMVMYAETAPGDPAIVPTAGTVIADPDTFLLKLKKRDEYKY